MIEAPAEVMRVDAGLAWVRLSERPGGCGRCDDPGGCRSMRIVDTFGAPKQEFVLPDPFGLQPGDRVRIAIPDGAPLRAALFSYGFGALAMLAGAACGSLIAGTDAADLGAGLGAIAGLTLVVAFNRVLVRSRRWRNGMGMSLLRDQGTCTQVGS